jgi:hypothetical protein
MHLSYGPALVSWVSQNGTRGASLGIMNMMSPDNDKARDQLLRRLLKMPPDPKPRNKNGSPKKDKEKKPAK